MDGSSRKILTMDNLKNWHICIVEWCCMCKVSGNLQIICLFIVIMHRYYGLWCFVCSVSLGLCFNTCICWLVGWGGLGDLIVGGCSSMYYMDYLERTKPTNFGRNWTFANGAEAVSVAVFVRLDGCFEWSFIFHLRSFWIFVPLVDFLVVSLVHCLCTWGVSFLFNKSFFNYW